MATAGDDSPCLISELIALDRFNKEANKKYAAEIFAFYKEQFGIEYSRCVFVTTSFSHIHTIVCTNAHTCFLFLSKCTNNLCVFICRANVVFLDPGRENIGANGTTLAS